MGLDKFPKYLLYGPGFASGSTYKKVRNIWTLDRDGEGHHCPEKSCGAMEPSCYDELHGAFCVEVVTTPDGDRFCGIRLGVVSPGGCVTHGWGKNDENRMFQRAKKNMSFDLPSYFPNMQPGWSTVMIVQNRPTRFTMGIHNNELYYFHEKPTSRPGEIIKRRPMLKIPQKELDMIGYKIPRAEVEEEISNQPEPVPKPAEVQAIVERERTSNNAFNNHTSYLQFNDHYSKKAETENWLAKDAKAAKNAEAAQAAKTKATKKAKEPLTLKGFISNKMHKPKKPGSL